MNPNVSDGIKFKQVKALSLAVTDMERAKRFYGETLGLPKETQYNIDGAFMIGNVAILLKPEEDWYGKPSEELNARITLEVADSYAMEKALKERGVTISDPVKVYDQNPVGGFLDSEGNKLWFCSDASGK